MSYKLESRATSNVSTRAFYGAPTKPSGITIHHWGRDGQKFWNVVGWLRGKAGGTTNRGSSAHYVVQDGLACRLAAETMATWHAGNRTGNGRTIGIEMRPEMTAGDYQTLVQLCVDIEKRHGSLKYYLHSNWKATACPGRYSSSLRRLIRDINKAHKGKPVKAPASVTKPSKATKPKKGVVYTNRRNAPIYTGTGRRAALDPVQPSAQNYKLARIGTKGASGSWSQIMWKGRKRWIKTAHVSTRKTPVIKYTAIRNAPIYVNRGTNKRLDPQQPVAAGYALAVVKTEGSWTQIKWKSNNRWIATKHLKNTR